MKRCPSAQLYALDLLPVQVQAPRLTALQGDFTDYTVRKELENLIAAASPDGSTKVDVVLSDMMGTTASVR